MNTEPKQEQSRLKVRSKRFKPPKPIPKLNWRKAKHRRTVSFDTGWDIMQYNPYRSYD